MTRHLSAENLARFRDGDLRSAKARRVEAHLAGCARCREVSAALAEVPALLAAAELPQIPAHLAARIETALATESAHRAAGSPSIRASRPGRAGRGEHADRGERAHRRPGLPVPAARILAAAAVVLVIGGGGYELISHLPDGSTAASSSSSSAERPAVGGHRKSAANGPEAPGAVSSPVYGPPVQYQHAGRTGTIRPVSTSTNYLAAQLARQATATLAEVRGTAAVLPGSHAGSRAGAPAFGTRQLARLPGCLSRVAAGRAVLLVNLARFSGSPATVIVTAAAGQAAEQVWVVGPGCSGSASDVLAHQQLPGRRAAGG